MTLHNDHYGRALGVFGSECRRLVRFAHIVQADERQIDWDVYSHFDDRTLQDIAGHLRSAGSGMAVHRAPRPREAVVGQQGTANQGR